MPIAINRPAGAAKPAGTFGFELFQTAYVTTDLDQAMAVFRDRLGVNDWSLIEPGHGLRIAVAWTAGHQIELIDAKGDEFKLYSSWVEPGRFTIRHHHFGYFIHSDEEWARLEQILQREGRDVVFGATTEMLRFVYVDAPELGHYLEYILPNEHGKAFFESVASN